MLQKRLDYGFNGYQVPYTPRATRSARVIYSTMLVWPNLFLHFCVFLLLIHDNHFFQKRCSFKKRAEDNQMCAFDLLATVAGKLLLEKQCTPSSSNTPSDEDQSAVAKEIEQKAMQDENKQLKVETCDQGSCDRGFFVSDLVSQAHDQKCSLKPPSCQQADAHPGFASVITTSDCSEGFGDQKLVNGKPKNEMGTLASKVEVGPSGYMGYGNCKVEAETNKFMKDESHKTAKVQLGTRADGCSFEDPLVWDGKPPAVSSDSSAKAPLCGDHSPHISFPASQDYVNVVSRDDDENSSGCTHPNTTKRSFRPAPRIGDRRIRKILASKYWKVAPKLKDATLSNTGKWLICDSKWLLHHFVSPYFEIILQYFKHDSLF